MTILVYRNQKPKPNSWVRYLSNRIDKNKNNLICVTGATGSGKTWSAISIAEKLSKKRKRHFGIENIVFNFKSLMKLINSNKLKKGSCIIFDEPQITISSKDHMSKANKIFNYLLSTFRHKNWSLFFCTPFADLLDKSTRKLFHAEFITLKINKHNNTCRVKPVIVEYNSHLEKFYRKFLKIAFKEEGKTRHTIKKISYWDINKPSKELIKLYEKKKTDFTTQLYKEIEQELDQSSQDNKKAIQQDKRKKLTVKQKEIIDLMIIHKSVKKVADIKGVNPNSIYKHLQLAKKKGYLVPGGKYA